MDGMKKKKYEHLNQNKRDRLQALLDSGHKQKEIAKVLKVDKSTISREIKRNRRRTRKRKRKMDGPYQASIAQHKAYLRRKYAKYQGKKICENDKLKTYITKKLKIGWSPDEISGRMKKERRSFYSSKTAIYEWLYENHGQYWCRYLYSKRYFSRKRKKTKTKKALIPNRIGLKLRPKGATNKTRYGHFEGDSVVSGKKTASKKSLAVVYEMKARYTDIKKIDSLKPKLFNAAILKMRDKLRKIGSLTLDNGLENQYYEELNIPTFFCDPYSSWQKPGVENANKMIRRFIPKGDDIGRYSEKYIEMIVEILNNKPRKSLNYKTPNEVMKKHNLLKTKEKNILKIKKPEVALRG